MAEVRSLVFKSHTVDKVETIVAMERECIPPMCVDWPIPGTALRPLPIKGIRTAGMDRILFTCFNKSSTASIIFRAKPSPGALDPDSGERVYIDPGFVTPSVGPGDNSYIDVEVQAPFYVVTALSDTDGEHDVVVFMDGYVRPR